MDTVRPSDAALSSQGRGGGGGGTHGAGGGSGRQGPAPQPPPAPRRSPQRQPGTQSELRPGDEADSMGVLVGGTQDGARWHKCKPGDACAASPPWARHHFRDGKTGEARPEEGVRVLLAARAHAVARHRSAKAQAQGSARNRRRSAESPQRARSDARRAPTPTGGASSCAGTAGAPQPATAGGPRGGLAGGLRPHMQDGSVVEPTS